ncbi:MAG: permease [Trueperaceae bacterium]|nr:permease [Trueperaceae bacterium]
MSTPSGVTSRTRRPVDPSWPWVGAATLAWIAAYRTILPFWNWAIYDALGLDPASHWGQAAHFFFYDTTKILLLLGGIVFLVAVLRSFMSVARTRALLGGKREGVGNVLAAGLGVVTPFCSCSAVPAFIGFVTAGVPLGVTLSFLIASPMVDVVAVTLLYGLFGWRIAALYVVSGLVLATLAGFFLGRLKLERHVEGFVYAMQVGSGLSVDADAAPTWRERFAGGLDEVRTVVGKIWPYLLVGIGVGAAIHGWVPESFFVRIASPDNVFAVPMAVLLGIPLYGNVAGILPLVGALQAKDIAMGTLLAFMMAVVALSLPEMILLRQVLKPRLIAVVIAVVGGGILFTGYLFNAILG